MRRLSIILILVAAFCVAASAADEKALVAHWDFDEGKGDVLHDRSGNKNDGKIHGAKWIRCGDGHALRFDGTDDYVTCGAGPSLDMRGAMTLEAWVYPEGRPKGEPGILGKQFSSFLITYYRKGNCYWYVNDGANYCRADVAPSTWSHIVATFDGTMMKLYLNGKLVGERKSKYPKVNAGRNLAIGCVLGNRAAQDPAYAPTAYFKGLIDEVRVYRRALSATEVRSHYRREKGTRAVGRAREPSHVSAKEILEAEGFSVKVGERGAMEIGTGEEWYLLESAFSSPGPKIGWNWLAARRGGSQSTWVPSLKRISNKELAMQATGSHYALHRTVRVHGGRVEVEDTLKNLRNRPVGLMLANSVISPVVFRECHSSGTPENPTVLVRQKASALGVVAEDAIGRLQFEAVGFSNVAGFEVKHFALDSRKSYTFRWAAYPFAKDADYFTFINRIRKDWETNFTIGGPFEFLSARRRPVNDAAQLKAHVTRKPLKVVALGPWLDYAGGQDLNRAQTKALLQKGLRTFRKVAPGTRCVGEVETDWVAFRPEKIPGLNLPRHKGGYAVHPMLTKAQTQLVDKARLPWSDSFRRRTNGNIGVELYTRHNKPLTAINVYPKPGNYQHKFLIGQVRFLMEEVGMDGLYIDDFSQAKHYSYDAWDGATVDIAPATGKITRQYTDCSLAGIPVRKEICDYVLSRGKVVVANTCAVVPELQALPVFRFIELPMGTFNVYSLKDGEKPPFLASLCRGHLASPIALGVGFYKPGLSSKEYGRGLMKGLITYLRNGILYYHHDPDIPETGPGAGEYGPVNHMFPITPVRLFEGGVEGKERTITCVSGTYMWNHERTPRILLFDKVGRETKHNFKTKRTDAGRQVVIELRDWQEIAVIEE